MEVWINIKGFDNKYEVSNYGRVRNSETKYILKQRHDKRGYLKINLKKRGSKKRNSYAVHRLVL